MTRRVVLALAFASLAAAPAALGQRRVVVVVADSTTGAPVPEAVGRLLRARRTELADRLGRLRLAIASDGDTLVVLGIGFRPETLLVGADPERLAVMLRRRPVTLGELTVLDAPVVLSPTTTGQWVVPRAALTSVPPAIEADPLRSLTMIPTVVFSSPLSARPVIRGYDAAEGVVRLDGFEVVNPYHIGRVFSGFAAEFTNSVNVAALPHRVDDAGSLAGVVDLVGRSRGSPTESASGGQASPASLAVWHGWERPLAGFAGGRLASLRRVSDVVGDALPYGFWDAYGRTRLGLGRTVGTDLTFYGSDDNLGESGGRGARWSNVVFGSRTRLIDRATTALDVVASTNRFELTANDLPARFSQIDVRNRFSRWQLGADLRLHSGAQWRFGGSVGRRRSTTGIALDRGNDFTEQATRASLSELAAHASARVAWGGAAIAVGLRVDASGSTVAWQPRVRVTGPLGRGVAGAVSYARAARLFHQLTDPQPEPSLVFYDFWLNAGERGVPVPAVDHVVAEADASRGQWDLHVAFYGSRGTGIGELRPVSDQRPDTSAFRFGDSRTIGVELHAGRRARVESGAAVSVTYALSWSQRRWADGVWRPWRLDQRHRARIQAEFPLASRWRLSAQIEGRSAQPEDRVQLVAHPAPPPITGDTAVGRFSLIKYVYAAEGSARGSGVYWASVGTSTWFRGPLGARVTLGLSVTNVTFGPVAPLEPLSPAELVRPNGTYPAEGVRYHRRFSLPAIPSATVRVEF